MTIAASANADPYLTPLEKIDVSDPALHQQDVVGAYFKRLRKEEPVHYCAHSPLGPYWSITKYRDIVHVDTNHKIFSSEGAIAIDDASVQGSPGGALPITAFIAMDPPRHDEQRRAVTPAVAPRNLQRLQDTIRERTCGVLDSLPLDEEFDWVDRVSIELTTQMLATLLDFPFEERRKLTRWSDVSTALPGTGLVASWEEKNAELKECAEYFQKLWRERVEAPPRSDLISMLAHSPATRDMSPVDFLSTLILLIVGGNDTTRNSMSGGVLALHENPQEFAKLKANPALVDSLVPEIIRWQSPIIYQARRAVMDTEIGGKKIRKGDKVAMWYLSGNRDDEVIERADDFIIDRAQPGQHVAFGYGIHRCMGNRLAELQLKTLWEEILKRFGRIEVVGPAKRIYSNVIRGISSLPVRIHA